MTDCNCVCATFGPGPHDKDARHPRPRSCEHDADPSMVRRLIALGRRWRRR